MWRVGWRDTGRRDSRGCSQDSIPLGEISNKVQGRVSSVSDAFQESRDSRAPPGRVTLKEPSTDVPSAPPT